MVRWFLGVALCIFGWQAVAEEHPACREMSGLSMHYDPDELMSIAASCHAPEVSELYLNRAYHLHLLDKYDRFERSLLHFGEQEHRAYIESYRIHIGLAEAFASDRLRQQDKRVLRRLNRIYDEIGEIAEMRFRGYDLIADRLERNYQM